jgi:hypothetical protein
VRADGVSTGFWGLKNPASGRALRALILGHPGSFFKDLLQASLFVEYYDEELEYEPYRLGVGTESVPPSKLTARLEGLKNTAVFLVGYPPSPALTNSEAGRGRVLFTPSTDAGGKWNLRASDTVIGPRRAGRAEGGGGGRPRVVTARELESSPGKDFQLPAAGEGMLVVDPLVMDPSLFPVPDNVEPGGLRWYPLTSLLRSLLSRAAPSPVLLLPCRLAKKDPLPPFVLARLLSKMIAYALSGGRGDHKR